MKYVWRFRILFYWLLGRRHGVTIGNLIKNITAPRFKQRAEEYIQSLDEDLDDYIVQIKGCGIPLYFPKAVGLDALYHVIPEICDKKDWHYYEIPETRVKPDDIVVDCGAAEGLFTLKIMDRCQHVYAIEPLPYFLQSLKKTFINKDKVSIIPLALGSIQDNLYITNEGMGAKVSTITTENPVKVDTIDNLFFYQNRKITYIKADLEGYELEMLAGAELTIKNYHPTIVITTYHQANHAQLIFRFLKKLCPNYTIMTKGIEDMAGAPILLHAWIDQ